MSRTALLLFVVGCSLAGCSVESDSGRDAKPSATGKAPPAPTATATGEGTDTSTQGGSGTTGTQSATSTQSGTQTTTDTTVTKGAPGTLDASFGRAGFTYVRIGASGTRMEPVSSVVTDGGKIAVAFSSNDPALSDSFYVLRLGRDGTLDTAFGGDGSVAVPFAGRQAFARSLVAGPDGALTVFGIVSRIADPTLYSLVSARLRADGSLDTTYGNGGKIEYDLGADSSFHAKAIPSSDGSMLVAVQRVGTFITTLIRVTGAGALDAAYAGSGAALVGSCFNFGLVPAAGGGAVTYCGPSGGTAGTLRTFTSGGLADNSFGVGSRRDFDYGSGGQANDLVRLADGSLVLAGLNATSQYLARFKANGDLDVGFGGGDGVVLTVDAGLVVRTAGCVAADAAGKIVEVLATVPADGGLAAFTALRFDAAGTPDSTFGDNGVAHARLAGKDLRVPRCHILEDGRLVLVGYNQDSVGGNAVVVARLWL